MVWHEVDAFHSGQLVARRFPCHLPSTRRMLARTCRCRKGLAWLAEGEMPLVDIRNLQNIFSQVFSYSHWAYSEHSIRTDSCCQWLTLLAPASPGRLLAMQTCRPVNRNLHFTQVPGNPCAYYRLRSTGLARSCKSVFTLCW